MPPSIKRSLPDIAVVLMNIFIPVGVNNIDAVFVYYLVDGLNKLKTVLESWFLTQLK